LLIVNGWRAESSPASHPLRQAIRGEDEVGEIVTDINRDFVRPTANPGNTGSSEVTTWCSIGHSKNSSGTILITHGHVKKKFEAGSLAEVALNLMEIEQPL
jgi:hypothetical protein